MAFIEKKNPIVLNIKLTSKGRELLSSGTLDFKYYAIGDSEIDYEFNKAIVDGGDTEYTAFDSTILRAADKSPNLISFIPRNLSGDPYNELSNVPSTAYIVENQVESIGFFTNNNTQFITDANHVKQPDAMIDMSGVAGGDVITLLKAPTYGTSGEEPAVGDILFVQWTHGDSTTGDSTFVLDKTYPQANLFYRITAIGAGTLASGNVDVTVDRNIPNFSGVASDVRARAMIYYNEINFSGDTILNMSPTDYLDESVLSFLENSQCPTVVFPYWNMSIIFTEEIAGVQSGNTKYTQFKDRTLGGFVSYIQNQAPVLKKLGVIHYTNSSPIMWHKSPTTTLGTTLSPIGGQQLLAGLNIFYYDLADSEGFIVGKMFPDLKIFVIEDQELLFAMSYKSNRSWTLPDYTATLGAVPPPCPVITGGTNVTWAVPVVNSGVACIVQYTGPYTGIEYCHSDLDWSCLPNWEVGDCLSLGNISDAGYRATICGYLPFGGTSVSIYARDPITGTNIDIDGVVINPLGCCTVTLNDINHDSGFYFKGTLT